jgi:hypothetical protein
MSLKKGGCALTDADTELTLKLHCWLDDKTNLALLLFKNNKSNLQSATCFSFGFGFGVI